MHRYRLIGVPPLTFDEYLNAADEPLYTYYQSITKERQIEELFHNRLRPYNNYLMIGGMPECVASWIRNKAPARLTQIQKELVQIYEDDSSKHNGKVTAAEF